MVRAEWDETMKKHNDIKSIAYICIILILVLLILLSGLKILESFLLRDQPEDTDKTNSKVITRDGVEYYPRQDITVVLLMGIDQEGPVTGSGSYNNSGAADMVSVLVFDEADESISVLCLNRDTMLDIPVLGIGGKQAGTTYAQLALAHTYGSGMEDSCENVKKAVSNFLYDIQIDYYVSMNMDAVAILNDAVGGVTVNVREDFSDIDPTITMGELTLRGEQAIHYVRSRKNVGDQMNVTRLERQRGYMEGFAAAMSAARKENPSVLVDAYGEVSSYMVTDCSANALSGMMERYSGYTLAQILTPEGENVLGQEYYEFYADQENLDQLILQLFYAEK